MSLGVLDPGGTLAAQIPHYEDRPEQRQMAAAVEHTLAGERALVVEAGTGTGKTLAYLVPALASGKRVVVSTGTRTLQEQIWRQDVPLLRDLLSAPFSAAILKGVSNYLCRRRMHEALVGPGAGEDLESIAAWAAETETGDRAELAAVSDGAAIWNELTVTPETRIGGRCPFYERCFVTRARRHADEADLVLVNHHLFFADLALRHAYPGARVLPDYDAVVFDEAHQLEDVLTDHFGVSVSTIRLAQLARDARTALGSHGALFGGTSERLVGVVERRGADLMRRLSPHVPDAGRGELDPAIFREARVEDAWLDLDTALDDLAGHAIGRAEDADDERTEELAALARRADAVRDDLATLAEPSGDDYVHWAQRRGGGLFLHASPVEVGDLMREHVVDRIPAVVLTSATLTTAGSFGYVRQRLGLDEELVDELHLSSPFDYRSQALLYLPSDLPDPREPAFHDAFAERAAELIDITDGRAFVLFTSHRGLAAATRRLRARLRQPLLAQGTEPRGALIERFRARPGAVLLGTGSFWEGVDIPGDALSLVIMDKVPFAPPTDPLVAARLRRLEARGIEPFSRYQVPRAALTLKQGFGRLIRRRDDRGIVALLDGRVRRRGYGRALLDALPEGLGRTGALEQVRRWWGAP